MMPTKQPEAEQSVAGPYNSKNERAIITCSDGFPIAATFFTPDAATRDPIVLIQSATGVVQTFYKRFATFLATHGMVAATYDYRGIGASLPETFGNVHPLAQSRDITILESWGEKDQTAIINYLLHRFPNRELVVVGNSVGGHLVPFTPLANKISRMLLIAVNNAYWGYGASKIQILVFSYFGPLLTRMYGYFPGERLGVFENIPAGVMAQWTEFCRHPEYIIGAIPSARAKFDAVKCPILGIGFSDDHIATRRSFETFFNFYRNCERNYIHLTPGDKTRMAGNLKSIGHFGFFMEQSERDCGIWTAVLEWLKRGQFSDVIKREIEIENRSIRPKL